MKLEDKEIDCCHTDFPVCPHCGETDQDWWDGLGSKNDGDSWVVTCGFCDKDYEVEMTVSTTFSTEALRDEPKADP